MAGGGGGGFHLTRYARGRGGVVPFNRVGQGMGGSGIPKYPK